MFGASKTCAGANNGVKRRLMIAGNWKMNKTVAQAVNLAQQISYKENGWDGVDVLMCPPFTCLKSVYNVLVFDKSDIMLGAQDVFWEDSGAYTGCVSPEMLEELRCSYCIVGHSERREYFSETNEQVNKKIKALFAKNIIPIMCCGENLETRDAGTHKQFVEEQIKAGLDGLDSLACAKLEKLVIAYEPIWAIGTGKAASPEQAQEMCAHIRSVVAAMFGEDTAAKVRVLYGGSMKPENAQAFLECSDCDGGLIGGASLKENDFAALVECAKNIKK